MATSGVLIVYKGNESPAVSGDILGARAHHGVRCPDCGNTQAQAMDGWLNDECRLYVRCTKCSYKAVIVQKFSGDTPCYQMKELQDTFLRKAWNKLHERIGYDKKENLEIEHKKSEKLLSK